ncbi:MAG: pyruvate, phosphate dikinase [Polyangiaceae bacterium]|nr:pyruvate, phosphate dikinase [Polyangiaceae bacterium]
MVPTTGLPALDEVLQGLRLGDNVVWKVDSVQDYLALAEPFWKAALQRGERLVYFRFAEHPEVVPPDAGVTYVRLRPEAGFEQFITHIHRVIAKTGRHANYVFDMFSDLVRDFYSECMVGNFFLLTCPYLYALDTVAYFALLRNYHSSHTIQPIAETAQLLIDVCRYGEKLYVHPLKVDERYSPTMHLYHDREGDAFVPVTDSAVIADIATSGRWPGLESASYRMVEMWDRRFMQAEETLEACQRGEASEEAVELAFERLLTQLLSRDERIASLARAYLTLDDLLSIWKRMVGSGMVGGKAVGMLLARAILRRADPHWATMLEPHDSFFVGSDVFYTYLVRNGCWWIRQKQKSAVTLLDEVGEARRRVLHGEFPEHITRRFADMLDYYGQSPIIVRSSSLLEDAFGNAFAGKYESVFCPNQGTHQQRLKAFQSAVRVIFASAMSEEALTYRARRGLLETDEQMALLVQRVSGAQYGDLFYPQLAGVGISVNPYVWHRDIDPEAGMLRVVYGLGTRAVERRDDDYTRVVALSAPRKRPEGSRDEARRHTQKRVDFLDLRNNRLASGHFGDVVQRSPGIPVEMFAEQDEQIVRPRRRQAVPWTFNLDHALSRVRLVEDMRGILRVLREAYGCDVDIEFTANLRRDGSYRLHLLQCRPLQMRQADTVVGPVPDIEPQDLVLRAHGAVIGFSRRLIIDRLIYVVPSAYGRLSTQKRSTAARLIGQLTRPEAHGAEPTFMLVGPGRWGSRMPELGVPVSSAEIRRAAVLCEIDAMHEGLSPELSLGTHFFHDLVELNMLYVGLFQAEPQNVLNQELLSGSPNRLAELLPDQNQWSDVVRVIEAPAGRKMVLSADHMKQEALLYLDRV